MAAERATAAEMMAPAAAVVMVGVMLGLGRVGGGSGWRQRASGTCLRWRQRASSVAAVQSSVARVRLRMRTLINFEARPLAFLGVPATGGFSITRGGEVRDLTPESLRCASIWDMMF